jgi:serine-type D-Ala-D-Ala carboxypeptidase (penicillin-binding protein 5/6)
MRAAKYVAALVLVLVIAAGVVAGIRWTRSIPAPTFRAQVVRSVVLPGSAPRLPWPTQGSAAVAIEGLGLLGSYGQTTPQAIASMAKVMTADVILTDHPLALGESGPNITFSAADAQTYRTDLSQSQSVIKVVAGESLTEVQCLEALLIPSANNVAIRLAEWDSTSVGAFVAKMNATAARLGLKSTFFTDPSGLEASTASVPANLIRLGEVAMANPVFASIVDMPQVTLPYNGTVYNFDYDLGRDGIVGIKTGSDSVAGGCFLFESIDHVAGRRVAIVGVVLGQQTSSPITAALDEAKKLVTAALGTVHELAAIPAGLVVGHIVTQWNSSVAVATTDELSVFGWPGQRFDVRLEQDAHLPSHITAGVQVGKLVLSVPGGSESTPVVASGTIMGPSDSWRLER